jgi:hypothetical protein
LGLRWLRAVPRAKLVLEGPQLPRPEAAAEVAPAPRVLPSGAQTPVATLPPDRATAPSRALAAAPREVMPETRAVVRAPAATTRVGVIPAWMTEEGCLR